MVELLERTTVDKYSPEVAKAIATVVEDSYVGEILHKFGEHLALPGGVDGTTHFPFCTDTSRFEVLC